jgi:hypothetical protein
VLPLLFLTTYASLRLRLRNKEVKQSKKRRETKFSYWSAIEAKILLGKRNEAKKLKRNEAKKLVLCFRLSMRKQSETDPVSLNFASKRKNILCETGAPYLRLHAMQLNVKFKSKIFLSTPRYAAQRGVDFCRRI